MGITIHYQLRLANAAALPPLVAAAREFATARGWPFHEIEGRPVEQYRPVGSPRRTYVGPASGVIIQPDEYCESVFLEFGTDLIACASTKTAYAGAEVHAEVVALLDALAPYVASLEVEDETGFWPTRDPSALRKQMLTRDELRQERLERIFSEPGARGARGGQPEPS